MILDILFLIVLVWGFYTGYQKGLLHAIFFLLALFIGIIVALKASHVASVYIEEWLSLNSSILPIVSFVIMFLIVAFTVILLGKAMEGVLKVTKLNIFNRLAGSFVWIILGMFFLSTVFWYGVKYHLISEEYQKTSHSYSIVEPVSPFVVEQTGIVFPVVEDLYGAIGGLIEDVAEENILEQKAAEIEL